MLPERKDVCDCGLLERLSKEPGHPVQFNPELNEYHLHHATQRTMIYYCPFCGGRAPASRRVSRFAHVSHAEQMRLREMFVGIRTEKDVRDRFGAPDEESDLGLCSVTPEKEGIPAHGEAARQLKYTRLSEVATLVFHAYGDGQVKRTWWAKAVRPAE